MGNVNQVEVLDGFSLRAWVHRCAKELRRAQPHINTLNVFPIPDSDTGSNMAHTIEAAAEAAAEADPHDIVHMTAAIAAGAARGARGNSGVMISQVFHAIASAATAGPLDAYAVARMLNMAETMVREALAQPMEGTLLSVLAATAKATQQLCELRTDSIVLAHVLACAVEAAEEALTKTPEQLPVLAQSGVVDAGGAGLIVMLRSLQDTILSASTGEEDVHQSYDYSVFRGFMERISIESSVAPFAPSSSSDFSASLGSSEGGKLEVMFSIDTREQGKLRSILNALGTSVIVAGVEPIFTVHVHTDYAGDIIERVIPLGKISHLRIEILSQGALRSTERSTEQAAIKNAKEKNGAEGNGKENDVQDSQYGVMSSRRVLVVALVPSASSYAWFDVDGVVTVAYEDIQAIQHNITSADVSHIVVLTNGCDTRNLDGVKTEITFIDTESLVGGIAAMAVYDPLAEGEDNIDAMIDAVTSQRRYFSSTVDLYSSVENNIDDGELVTILYSSAEDQVSIEESAEKIMSKYPHVDVYYYRVNGLGTGVEIGIE